MKFVRARADTIMTYKTDIDYSRPISWALITVGYKRMIRLDYYDLTTHRVVSNETLKTVRQAKAFIDALATETVKRQTPAVDRQDLRGCL